MGKYPKTHRKAFQKSPTSVPKWCYMIAYGAIWCYMVLDGAGWCCVVPKSHPNVSQTSLQSVPKSPKSHPNMSVKHLASTSKSSTRAFKRYVFDSFWTTMSEVREGFKVLHNFTCLFTKRHTSLGSNDAPKNKKASLRNR